MLVKHNCFDSRWRKLRSFRSQKPGLPPPAMKELFEIERAEAKTSAYLQ